MTAIRYDLFADYFQFYLQDDDDSVGDLSEAWTEEAVERLLAVSRGVVGIATVRNMTVPSSWRCTTVQRPTTRRNGIT